MAIYFIAPIILIMLGLGLLKIMFILTALIVEYPIRALIVVAIIYLVKMLLENNEKNTQ